MKHPLGIKCSDVCTPFNFNLGSAVSLIWKATFETEGMTLERLQNLIKAKEHLESEIAEQRRQADFG